MPIWNDLRLAGRALRRAPGFSLVAILTLALGIGACTAIFSVVQGVLLAPLPYPDSGRIVSVNTRWRNTGRVGARVTGGDWIDLRSTNVGFEAISSYFGGELGVQLPQSAEFTGVYWVNSSFFRVFGVPPGKGRVFADAEQERAAVVSQPFAERNFGSAAAVLGRTLRIEDKPYEIVGVMPAGFRFPATADVWACAPYEPQNRNRTAFNYQAVARLARGTSVEAARGALEALGARLEAAYPAENKNKSFTAIGLRERLTGPVRPTLMLLMGAVGLVLLIACANVAGLLLARGASRGREVAVRMALGAGRRQVARNLLAESLVLALAAGIGGVLLASQLVNALLALAPGTLPRLNEVGVNPVVLGFAILISVGSCVVFGLGPAWHASKVDVQETLKQGGTRGVLSGGHTHFRQALVACQVALAVVLAVGAGLLARSLAELGRAPLGFDPSNVLVMYAHAPANGLEGTLRAGRFFESLLPELAALPGVRSTAAAMGLPAGKYGSNGMYAVEGKHEFRPGAQLPSAGFRLASPGYFRTLRVPLLAGRDFTPQDRYESEPVAIISQALARETFPHENPIGRRIACGLDRPDWMRIVGMVGDVRQDSPASAPEPQLYMPLLQHPFFGNEVQIVARTAVAPESLTAAARELLRRRNPAVACSFTTLERMLGDSIAAPRFRAALASCFALLALLLTMAGVYALAAYVVSRRTAEMGLRVALGARPADLARRVLGEAVPMIGAGVAAGLLLAAAAGRLTEKLLYGVRPLDAWTYVAVALMVAAAVLVATGMPSLRAARTDPLAALREE
jgi:putative ABC transport system permease protein